MSDEPAILRAFALQAGGCRAFGSEFSARLMEHFAEDWRAGGATRALFAAWDDADARAIMTDAAPLRLLGALHALAQSGAIGALSAAYPGAGQAGDAEAAWRAAQPALTARADYFAGYMRHEPQTNEVRRSAVLLGGFLTAARETGLPLRTFELGASAGLNQFWDRFHYDLGPGLAWGPADSPVRIPAEWRGAAPPLDTPLRVVARAGCDRAPIDIRDPDQRLRLRSYIWADQADRLARTDAAIALALEGGVALETADAPAWAARITPEAGTLTIIYHSVFWQYMPPESQAAARAAIAALGATATKEAPVAWLRMEPAPQNLADMLVQLTLWPDGEERLLGHAHPHGAWVDWV
jgi:hypothetical protein